MPVVRCKPRSAIASLPSGRDSAASGDILATRRQQQSRAQFGGSLSAVSRRAPHHLRDLLATGFGSKALSSPQLGISGSSAPLLPSTRQSPDDQSLPCGYRRPERLSANLRRCSGPPQLQSARPGGTATDEDATSAKEELSQHTCLYMKLAAETRGAGRFVMLGYPDLIGAQPPPFKEAFSEKKGSAQNELILRDLRRVLEPDEVLDRVVYDLDATISKAGDAYTWSNSDLSNHDEVDVGCLDVNANHLQFESQFECGNLRKVVQVRKHEYDLVLSPDINTNHHVQWFYFRVSNIHAGIRYRFNFVNCEKPNSQLNFGEWPQSARRPAPHWCALAGMKPVAFSVTEAWQGRPFWVRVGSKIAYYRNHFSRGAQTAGGQLGRNYFTASVSLTFKHHGDIVYLAYHYPYSYTHLAVDCKRWEAQAETLRAQGVPVYFRAQSLSCSLLGNSAPLLTITAPPRDESGAALQAFREYCLEFAAAVSVVVVVVVFVRQQAVHRPDLACASRRDQRLVVHARRGADIAGGQRDWTRAARPFHIQDRTYAEPGRRAAGQPSLQHGR